MVAEREPDIFYYIGVSTNKSSIRSVFPAWMEALGKQMVLEGYDLPIGAEPRQFRAIIDRFMADPRARGGLITTHKIDLYRSCADLFDELDPIAQKLGEVSCIIKHDGKLKGRALDPVAAQQAIEHFIEPGHWQRHRADLLCLGAGGAGMAISYVAIAELVADDRPARIVISDIDSGRLETLGHLHDRLKPTMPVQYHRVFSAADNDRLLTGLRPYSLVVNATGLGKDAPGSPLSDGVSFPDRSLIWELNYSGERRFLAQAEAQGVARSLVIEDGWRYFIRSWTETIAAVLGRELTAGECQTLSTIAGPNR